jgi:uncharacterized protein
MDVSALDAIDVHTHVHRSVTAATPEDGQALEAMAAYFKNTLLKDKVLFGTDFPMLTPERWRGDLEQTAIRDEIKPALYKHNAARLLGL